MDYPETLAVLLTKRDKLYQRGDDGEGPIMLFRNVMSAIEYDKENSPQPGMTVTEPLDRSRLIHYLAVFEAIGERLVLLEDARPFRPLPIEGFLQELRDQIREEYDKDRGF